MKSPVVEHSELKAFVVSILAIAAVSACSTDAPEFAAQCGGATFESLPPVLEPLETLDDVDHDAIVESLEAANHFDGRTWLVADDDEDQVVLLGSPSDPNSPYGYATFPRSDDGLVRGMVDNCNLGFNTPGQSIASFRVDPERPLDPDASEVNVLFTERACAGGGDLQGRAVRPSVLQTPDRIEILMLVDALEGPQPCPGNQEIPWTVALDEPIGNRSIADASQLPARKVR